MLQPPLLPDGFDPDTPCLSIDGIPWYVPPMNERNALQKKRARDSQTVCGHVSYSSPNQCVLMRAQHGGRWSICATAFYMYYLPLSGLRWMANLVFDAVCRWLRIPHNLYAFEIFVTVVKNYPKTNSFHRIRHRGFNMSTRQSTDACWLDISRRYLIIKCPIPNQEINCIPIFMHCIIFQCR